jgi:hypothetical protein
MTDVDQPKMAGSGHAVRQRELFQLFSLTYREKSVGIGNKRSFREEVGWGGGQFFFLSHTVPTKREKA